MYDFELGGMANAVEARRIMQVILHTGYMSVDERLVVLESNSQWMCANIIYLKRERTKRK
jgi:hypothetical protein